MPRKRLTSFGEYLKKNRKRTGLSQAEIAQRLGMSQSLVAQLETGRISNPDKEMLRIIATIYDIDYDRLVWELMSEKYDLQGSSWLVPKERITKLRRRIEDRLRKGDPDDVIRVANSLGVK